MSYSITIRQASLYASAYGRFWDLMFTLREEFEIPKGMFFDFGDANQRLTKLANDAGDCVLPSGRIVKYDDFFDDGMVVWTFSGLSYYSAVGDGVESGKFPFSTAREARRQFAYWINIVAAKGS